MSNHEDEDEIQELLKSPSGIGNRSSHPELQELQFRRRNKTMTPTLWSRVSRIVVLILAALGCAVLFVSVIDIIPSWRPQLFRLLWRAWSNMLPSISHTGLGIAIFFFVFPTLRAFYSAVASKNFREVAMAEVRKSLAPDLVVGIAILTVLLGWSLTRTVRDDHEGLVVSSSNFSTENQRLNAANRQLKSDNDALKNKPTPRGTVITKLVQPQDMPLRISVREYGGLENRDKSGSVYFIVGTTNKTVTPVNVTLTCDEDFEAIGPAVLIAKNQFNSLVSGISFKQVDKRNYEYHAISPAWSPDYPLGFSIFTPSSHGIACQIVQLP